MFFASLVPFTAASPPSSAYIRVINVIIACNRLNLEMDKQIKLIDGWGIQACKENLKKNAQEL